MLSIPDNPIPVVKYSESHFVFYFQCFQQQWIFIVGQMADQTCSGRLVEAEVGAGASPGLEDYSGSAIIQFHFESRQWCIWAVAMLTFFKLGWKQVNPAQLEHLASLSSCIMP